MKNFRETCAMFEQMEIAEQVYKGKIPSEKYLGQIPTVIFILVNKQEEKTPLLPNSRRAALASTRQKFSLSDKT